MGYTQLSTDERNHIQRGLNAGQSIRSLSRELGRAPSTISRELHRNKMTTSSYDALTANKQGLERVRRGARKMLTGSKLESFVHDRIKHGWSPQQISGHLEKLADAELPYVSHEKIYQAIYVLPRGELRKELIGCLRQSKKKRGRRTPVGSGDNILKDIVTIHQRPAEVATRLVAGDWEGDLVKGAKNGSAIATLVERHSRYVIIMKLENGSAQAALDGFTKAFTRIPAQLRRSMTYDRGREMSKHKDLAKAAEIKVYFCDPHSPWQRPSNENMNGLIRQYFPKGTDFSEYTQEDMDLVAHSLNTRPRACLKFSTPHDIFLELSKSTQSVALQN